MSTARAGLSFVSRDSLEQVRPLHYDDAFPGLRRNGIGDVMALAYRQVSESALGILGLTDIQQAATADVDAVYGVVRDRRSVRCRADK
jgi:hypothetical protein